MKFIGIALIVVGVLALVASTIGFGDIGLSFGVTGVVAILCGIGFLKVNKRVEGKAHSLTHPQGAHSTLLFSCRQLKTFDFSSGFC